MNTKQGIAPILIALILALLAGGGYAVVKTNPGLAKKLGFEKQVEKKESVENADWKADWKTYTPDWKTYASEKYGFEVQYPAQWEIGKSSVKNNHPENSTSFMTLIMGYVREPEINVSVSTERAQNAETKIQRIIDTQFSYDGSISEVAKDISKESSRYQVYNFTNPNGVKIYSYSFVGKYSETSRHFFFDTANATIVFSITSTVSCAKGCAFSTENEAFLAVPALKHWIDSIKLPVKEQSSNWKTYNNEKYGFEFQYPSANWYLHDKGYGIFLLKVKDFPLIESEGYAFGQQIFVSVGRLIGPWEKKFTLEQYVQYVSGDNEFTGKATSIKSVKVNNLSMFRVEHKNKDKQHELSFYYSRDEQVFEFYLYPFDTSDASLLKNYNDFEKILSTFTFTK